VLFGLSYNTQLYVFRIGIWVVPALLFLLTRRFCLGLQAADFAQAEHEAALAEAERRQVKSLARTERA
jgi:hypothetical protein